MRSTTWKPHEQFEYEFCAQAFVIVNDKLVGKYTVGAIYAYIFECMLYMVCMFSD